MSSEIAVLKADTSIPLEIKVLLDSLKPQDEHPPELAKWAREVFKKSREREIPDFKIARMVEAYANSRNYSTTQISRVLIENHFRRQEPHTTSLTGSRMFEPVYYINTLEKITQGLTGLKEFEILKIDSPRKLVEVAEGNLTELVRRMSKAEVDAYCEKIDNIDPLFKRLRTKLEEQKAVIKRNESFGR